MSQLRTECKIKFITTHYGLSRIYHNEVLNKKSFSKALQSFTNYFSLQSAAIRDRSTN